MAKRKSSEPDEKVLESALAVMDAPVIESIPDGKSEEVPAVGSVEWTPFVMSKFRDDELFEGCPTVDGLRRVCLEHLGDVIESVTDCVQAPNAANMNHSCVMHTLTLDCYDGVRRKYSGLADVFTGNGDNPVFSFQYSSATCETRAEGRAYRRALRLRGVVAAEELGTVPPEESGADGTMSAAQQNVYSIICKRLNINVMKYLNKSKQGPFKSAHTVPYSVAVKAFASLQGYQQDMGSIPVDIKGYDDTWCGGN